MTAPAQPVGAPAPAAVRASALPAPLAERRPRLRATAVSLTCSALGPLVFLVGVGWTLESGPEPQRPGLWALLLVLDAAVGIAAGALAGFFRGSRTACVALVVAATVSTWALPAGVVGAVRVGARRSVVLESLVVAVAVVGGLGYARLLEHATSPEVDPLPLVVEVLALAAAAALLLLWGRVRATRAALLASLREQASAAERERAALTSGREADVARTRAEERSAIARDMHDTLSHQLSLIAMHAGALASRDDLPPERAREAARTVRDAAADANAVLREVLTALRSTDPAQRLGHHGGAEPLPTSASVDALAARARARGQRVDVVWRGLSAPDLDERSPATAVSLAQVTAELLVNADKHAPGAPVALVLAHEGEDLVLRASNPLVPVPPTALGTGLGLVGVGERARLLGGRSHSGTTPDGRFVVEVVVPWRA
ncbi:sensor histidine kinase [uncultured Pseudokineococcus sp.]|uniref:sensor histidine kinase n=1 Tax=uncultured Pseudokineococcus sp. TaxID=1642928 RepID=UPI002614D17F|nr:histidine kinase [uncultured Pseudokineococcus sp.]